MELLASFLDTLYHCRKISIPNCPVLTVSMLALPVACPSSISSFRDTGTSHHAGLGSTWNVDWIRICSF